MKQLQLLEAPRERQSLCRDHRTSKDGHVSSYPSRLLGSPALRSLSLRASMLGSAALRSLALGASMLGSPALRSLALSASMLGSPSLRSLALGASVLGSPELRSLALSAPRSLGTLRTLGAGRRLDLENLKASRAAPSPRLPSRPSAVSAARPRPPRSTKSLMAPMALSVRLGVILRCSSPLSSPLPTCAIWLSTLPPVHGDAFAEEIILRQKE